MNVLSLFDGMSCAQIALERAGVKVDNYFASEIDKYAIKVTMSHYPNTIQLGDITKWGSWDLPKIDLLIGGSPCQGFSNAGLGLNFDDPRSKLFFVYVDILKALKVKNPDLQFLLENVKMKKEWQKIISDFLGVEPVLINSALMSAQNRQRLYWANWKIEQPEDKHIYLKDIIEEGEVDREKSYTIDANYFKGGNPRSYFEDGKRQLVFEHQSHKRAMVKTIGHGYVKEKEEEMDIYPSLCAQNPRSKHLIRIQGAAIRNQVTKRGVEEQLNVRKDEKSNCVVPTYPNKLNGLVYVGGIGDKDWAGDGKNLSRNYPQGRRVYSAQGKSTSLTSQGVGSVGGYTGIYEIEKDQEFTYRKLTPLECERLQTVPDNWTNMVSNTQRYKMLGNGFTVDVIAHILNSNPNLR